MLAILIKVSRGQAKINELDLVCGVRRAALAHNNIVQLEIIVNESKFVQPFQNSNQLNAYLADSLQTENTIIIFHEFVESLAQFLHDNKGISIVICINLLSFMVILFRVQDKLAAAVHFRKLVPHVLLRIVVHMQQVQNCKLLRIHFQVLLNFYQ